MWLNEIKSRRKTPVLVGKWMGRGVEKIKIAKMRDGMNFTVSQNH